MIKREFWLNKIRKAWQTRPVVWLSGVRRVGKTSLARAIPDAVFLNCDLASTMRRLEDPETFFQSQKNESTIILDEIHRLPDPSNVLKIAADAFPGLRVLATGSSTLSATRKFRDSLTGRKWAIYLSPVLWDECLKGFDVRDLDIRLLHGGLPEPLLAEKKNTDFFAEWMDSYYARDIAELFAVRDRSGFLRLLRLLFYQSGGLADISKLASESGLSRPTVMAHIEAMTVAHALFALRPFQGGGRREIVHRPKIYAFDTGFVTFARGWDTIRDEDRGILWEHLALDALRAAGLESQIHYWRDKSGREIDFVLRRGNGRLDTIECKVNPDRFNVESLRQFRSIYRKGANFAICPMVTEPFMRNFGKIKVHFTSTFHIISKGHSG